MLNQIGKDYVIYGDDGKPVTLGVYGVEYFEHIKSKFTVAYADVNNDDNLDRIESHNFAYYDEIDNYDYVFKVTKLRLNIGTINFPDRSVNDISLISDFFTDNINFADFNGNGNVEVVLYGDEHFYNIGEFDNVLNDFNHWGVPIGATGSASKMRLVDLNNDGKTDYLWYNNSWEAWYSTGTGFVQGAALGLNNTDPSMNGMAYDDIIISGFYPATDIVNIPD